MSNWKGSNMSFAAPLAAAARALVLLDMLCLCRGNADTLAMEPLLTDIAANPKFTIRITLSTRATQISLVLVPCILPTTVFLVFRVSWLCRLTVRIVLF
jgi:hypothetical protein